MHHRAFTLIELLVVITFISIIAVIVFPVFVKTRLVLNVAMDGQRHLVLSNDMQAIY